MQSSVVPDHSDYLDGGLDSDMEMSLKESDKKYSRLRNVKYAITYSGRSSYVVLRERYGIGH